MNGQMPMFTAQKCGLQVSQPLLRNHTLVGLHNKTETLVSVASINKMTRTSRHTHDAGFRLTLANMSCRMLPPIRTAHVLLAGVLDFVLLGALV